MDYLPTIITERLKLRPFQIQDATDLKEIAGDRAVAEMYSELPHPFEMEMAEGFIRMAKGKFEVEERVILAIVLRSTDSLIGGIGLEIKVLHHSGELGYFIGRPYWNQGFATEAAKALLLYAFEQLGLNRIQARHMPKNPASGRVLQKCGMKQEGVLRKSLYRFGRFEDAVLYAILRDEFTVTVKGTNQPA